MNQARTILNLSVAAVLALPSTATLAQAAKAPPTPAQAPAGCPVATGDQIKRMQEMHAAMMNAGTPQERAKLREQQWTLMHQGMRLMSSMPGGSMGQDKPGPGMGMGRPGMGPGMGMAGSGMGMGGACAGERMAMMEMMMQMMMDRMAPEATPAK